MFFVDMEWVTQLVMIAAFFLFFISVPKIALVSIKAFVGIKRTEGGEEREGAEDDIERLRGLDQAFIEAATSLSLISVSLVFLDFESGAKTIFQAISVVLVLSIAVGYPVARALRLRTIRALRY